MIKKPTLFMLLFVLAITGCRADQPRDMPEVAQSLMTYGQRTSLCYSGYVDSGVLSNHVRGYSIPLLSRYAGIEAQWHDRSHSIILIDDQAFLHQLQLSDSAQVVEIELPSGAASRVTAVGSYGLTLSKAHELAAFMVQMREGRSHALTDGFGLSSDLQTPIVVGQVNDVALHPTELILAGSYVSESQDLTNIIGLFDLAQPPGDPSATFRLNDYAIYDVFGWSSDGEIIAVSQTEMMGVIPYFLFVQDGDVERSLFERGCAVSASWSPSDAELIYSGTGEEEAGINWDLYLETVKAEPGEERAILNLTSTGTKDEIAPAWAPEGNYIAYAKAFADAEEALWQDLFVIDLHGGTLEPRRLTSTADEYETNPMWISDTEIAYLSWVPEESAWYLKTLYVAEPNQTPVTTFKLPESWYRAP